MAEFRMYVDMEGDADEILYFDAAIERVHNLIPVMEEIFTDMLEVEASVFHSKGRRGGGSWKELADSTVRQKGNDTILVDTGDLLSSVSERGAPFQAKEVTNNSVGLGTRRPWWYVHQYGSKRVPKRPFLRFAPYDEARWNGWISDYLVNPGNTHNRRGRRRG